MALINRKSDLTTLKFGKDRRGGGDSGLPYITKGIPDRDQSIDFATSFLGNDFLNRGGVISLSNTLQDQERISKYFLGGGKSVDGLLFVAKQKMLARQNSVTGAKPDRTYNPANTIAQVGAISRGQHFMKDGKDLILSNDESYYKLTKSYEQGYNTFELGANNRNRLLLLYETKVLSHTPGPDLINEAVNNEARAIEGSDIRGRGDLVDANRNTGRVTSTSNILTTNLGRFGINTSDRDILFSYQGGPNSKIGGKTTIRRSVEYDTNLAFSINQKNNNQYFKFLTYTPDQLSNVSNRIGSTRNTGYGFSSIRNFTTLIANSSAKSTRIGKPIDYADYNRAEHLGEGNPGSVARNKSVYYTTNIKKTGEGEAKQTFEYDKINAQKLYSSNAVNSKAKDIVKFHIGAVNLDSPDDITWMHFRAYITSFNDQYNADFQEYKYMGRGNPYYKYNGYSRSIGMSFEVALQSRYEQPIVYSKLNYLASLTAPNYSSIGFMRSNILKVTIGDYLNNTYGILRAISYTIPDDSPWDIGNINNSDRGIKEDSGASQLPMRISVSSFEFTPIHNFYDSTVENINGIPEQRFISLGEQGNGYPLQQSSLS